MFFHILLITKEKAFSGWMGQYLVSPIHDFLYFLVDKIPGHNLALAIILLTIIFRLALYIPTYKSLRQQKIMKEIQPDIAALREKYKNNSQLLSQKTMELYKQHKVNPFSSCLPLIIQLPILMAIYRVMIIGIEYDGMQTFFLGADLTKPERIFFPLAVGVSQFISMKLMTSLNKQKQHKLNKQEKTMMSTTQTMTYIMPVFIAFIARNFPAGLSLYWIVSTLFATSQQLIINFHSKRSHAVSKPQVTQ